MTKPKLTRLTIKTEVEEIALTISSDLSSDEFMKTLETFFYSYMGWKPEGQLEWVREDETT